MTRFAPITDEMSKEFYHKGNNIGILLIHGYTATPSQMIPLGDKLKEKGYTVLSILLPGHGLSVKDMEKSNWQQWLGASRDGFHRLAETCDKIFIGGISMGGLLALILAAEIPITGVFTMGAAFHLQGRGQRLAKFIWPFYRYRKWKFSPLTDKEMSKYNIGYDVMPMRKLSDFLKLRKIAENNLSNIHCPMLIAQGLKDSMVSTNAAQEIYNRATGTPIKKLLILKNSPHVLTTGPEFKELWYEIDKFILDNI